jgi:hypothetical protein
MKTKPRRESNGDGSGRREEGKNAKKKRQGWMMKTLT